MYTVSKSRSQLNCNEVLIESIDFDRFAWIFHDNSHTHTHTYLNTYILTLLAGVTWVRTKLGRLLDCRRHLTDNLMDLCAHILTYINAHTYVSIYTYIHMYIHTYMYVYINANEIVATNGRSKNKCTVFRRKFYYANICKY